MRGSSDTEDYEEEAVAHSARLGVQSGPPSTHLPTHTLSMRAMMRYCLRHCGSRGGDRQHPLSLPTAPAAPREAAEELQLRQGLGRGAG